MALLEIKNLTFIYSAENESSPVLQNINLSVYEGEFILLAGATGCGKSTLLRLLKRQIAPNGSLSGSILFDGKNLDELSERESVSEIGFVGQNPDDNTVTDKVWHEMAFGLESLGYSGDLIRRRTAETASFLGISKWFDKSTDELSGGQKQLLSLSSVLCMQPKLLLLDEPTSQLDPIAASEFITAVKRVNLELGITVIMVEHRLEELFPIVNRVALMKRATLVGAVPPREIVKKVSEEDLKESKIRLPSAIEIFSKTGGEGECPLSITEGKTYLKTHFFNVIRKREREETKQSEEVVLQLKDAYFKYEKSQPDILKGLNLEIRKGEILSILGDNGVGKSTLIKVMSGIEKIYSGKLRIFGKKRKDYSGKTLYRENIAALSQNPRSLFIKNGVYEELFSAARVLTPDKTEARNRVMELLEKFQLSEYATRHPYDLSGGQQQLLALAEILLMKPKILLLDEPTKGLDFVFKAKLAELLKQLTLEGKTVVIATHDIEFSCENATECALLFDGNIVSKASTARFFSENVFYTSVSSRLSRGFYDGAVTTNDVIELANLNGRK